MIYFYDGSSNTNRAKLFKDAGRALCDAGTRKYRLCRKEKQFVMGKHSTGTPERFDGGKNKYQKE